MLPEWDESFAEGVSRGSYLYILYLYRRTRHAMDDDGIDQPRLSIVEDDCRLVFFVFFYSG